MGIISKCKKHIRILFYKLSNCSRLTIQGKQRIWERGIRFEIEQGGHITVNDNAWIRENSQFWSANGVEIELGKNVFVNTGTIISARKKISIGNNTIIGPNVLIYDHDHDFRNHLDGFVEKEVKIGNNVWIGGNVCILKGVTIGDNSVIGAGTVVTKDVPANCLVTSQHEITVKKIDS